MGNANVAFFKAVKMGNLAKVEDLMHNPKVDLSGTDEAGNTPLHVAAAEDHPDIVRALIAAGANVNALDAGGRTPLHRANTRGRPALVDQLIEAGVDVNHIANNGDNALHGAAALGKVGWWISMSRVLLNIMTPPCHPTHPHTNRMT